jgi:hypothetical protein
MLVSSTAAAIGSGNYLRLRSATLVSPFDREGPLSDHRFKIGQAVNYNPRSGLGAGVYLIVQLMPAAGDEPQYRIKSETEPRLRSAKESELTASKRR